MKNKVLGFVLACTMGTALLTGCGSDSKKSSSLAVTEDGLTKVTFVSPTSLESYDYLAIYAGQYLGYFEDEGLEVELVEQTGTDDVKMLAAGTAQFAYPSPGVMWSCIDAGITDVRAICNYDSIMIFGFAVNPQSGIKTFADVKGKDVALATESWSSLLAPIFSGAGMSVSDVNMVSYGDGRYEAVASNSAPVLGTWLSESWTTSTETKLLRRFPTPFAPVQNSWMHTRISYRSLSMPLPSPCTSATAIQKLLPISRC